MDKRISWLDSARMPARIHLTVDEGNGTVCGAHFPLLKHNAGIWVITSGVPRRIQGESRYCRTCFRYGGKTLPWFEIE